MERRQQGKVRVPLVLTGAALAVAIVAAVAFGAYGGIKAGSAPGTLSAYPAAGSVTADCPGELKAVSGGFTTTDYDATAAHTEVNPYGSQRLGSKSWRISEYSSGNDEGSYTGYVYCARGADLETRSATTTVTSGALGTATATCPRNRRVVSGGFTTPNFDPVFTESNIQPLNSVKSGARSWKVRSINFGGADGTLKAFAYCSVRGVTTKLASAPVGAAPDTSTVSATCDLGRHVVSGGFSTPVFDPTFPNPTGPEIEPWSSRRTGARTWTVKAANFSDTAGTIRVFAYCRQN